MLRYDHRSQSAGNKKWVSAAVAADYGDSQALFVPPKTPWVYGIAVGAASLHNRSGGVVQVGLGARYPVSTWKAGQVTAAGVFTDDTPDAQDIDASDFQLHNRAEDGSGFLVSCDDVFNILGIIQGTAGDQTLTAQITEYWNGSAWTDIQSSLLIADNLITGTGEKILCFPLPSDWAKGGTGTNVPADKYNLRVRQDTSAAGTVDPQASQLFVGFTKMQLESLADNGVSNLIRDNEYLFPRIAEALFPVFSTAHRANTVEADVRAV